MGQWIALVAAEPPVSDGSAQSITVALIATLGTVAVALITLAGSWLAGRGRTATSPPAPATSIDPKLGERIAVTEVRVADSTRTLDVLDRHVDGLDDRVDELRWQMDDLRAWRDEHQRRHGPTP